MNQVFFHRFTPEEKKIFDKKVSPLRQKKSRDLKIVWKGKTDWKIEPQLVRCFLFSTTFFPNYFNDVQVKTKKTYEN